ncbi:hypothetical protein [Mucilaginibacter lappiensis]|uniref:hypothetical protein n=1 Tax=Mucilaginibacter lappiensis TaxID=354630 RepID=UPI003D1F64C1
MKKYAPLLLLVCFFAFSCKKDHRSGTDPDIKTYDIKFNLSDSTQLITNATGHKIKVNGVKTNATPIPITNDYFKSIRYVVYGAAGNVFRALNIDSTASNFGTISDKLPAGTYTIGIGAGKAGLKSILGYPAVGSDYQYYYADNNNSNAAVFPWGDTFVGKFKITVQGDINQTVTLSRIVGQLEVNIEDAIPANVKTIVVTVNKDYYYYAFGAEQPNYSGLSTLTTVVPDAVKGTTNFKVDNIICNTITPFSVTITAYDANHKSVGAGVTVTNVICEKNRRTILSGKLFNGLVNNNFSIGINDWDPDPINVEY